VGYLLGKDRDPETLSPERDCLWGFLSGQVTQVRDGTVGYLLGGGQEQGPDTLSPERDCFWG